jgi:FtsP/CotA-like multicopper oxidase with cupredoxin domain
MHPLLQKLVGRRSLLTGGAVLAGTTLAGSNSALAQEVPAKPKPMTGMSGHRGQMITVGNVGLDVNSFDPSELLTDWDSGVVTQAADGTNIRTFEVIAEDRDIEIAPGVIFPAWTFNGRVPGPTLRATEGDRLRIVFKNFGSHPHSMHFHGIHSAAMDGLDGSGLIDPGEEFIYEFTAKPFGCHLYHCHAFPLRAHMHKGMYGAFIVDPDPAKHPEFQDVAASRLLGSPENKRWQELVMVMNGFDTNFDGANEFYAVNTVAHHYMKNPIRIEKSRPVRIYLVNATEFDPINSLHLHANFFDYYDHGTTLTPTQKTVDTIMQCQAQRGILEFSFADHDPGKYMFHAHQSEFAELGWMSLLDVVDA